MRSALVVVSWEKPELIKVCMESALEHRPSDCEIIVIDNGSKGDVLDLLNDYDKEPGVEVLFTAFNHGCPKALNKGFEMAENRGIKYAFRCDNDIEFTKYAIDECLELCVEHNAIVSPSTNSALGEQTQPAKEDMSPRYPDRYKWGTFAMLPLKQTLTGFCNCIPIDLWNDVGKFPTKTVDGKMIRIYEEDTLFCYRAALKGYMCVIAKHAWVKHLHRGSVDLIENIEEVRAQAAADWRKQQECAGEVL